MRTIAAHKVFPIGLAIAAMAIASDAMAMPEPDDIAGPPPFSINGCPANATWTRPYLAKFFGVTERTIRRAASKYGMDGVALCTAHWRSVEHALVQASMPKAGYDQPDKAQEFRALSLRRDDGSIVPDGIQKAFQQRLKVLADTR